ncbi:ATP-binding protein [Streptomyces sp. CA-210063]|uniref:ATP-binding protein n=1 Tax=Streptomyces sp. CA-210063 TaxID=2801029 RepID=UPI00214BC366|nr:ATP-binding protein [Streptomyces sp. CA-210063]UUU31205.1 ATP-binding protein [Streptomyces sp. CA-210063]
MPEATSACPVPPARSSSTAPRPWECRLDLPNDPRTPHIARHTIRAALLGHACSQDLTDTAELLTSELLSNSVKHSDGLIVITLRTRHDHIHVAVMDNHPELPNPLPSTTDQEFGRGLFLVDALADVWGRYPVTGDFRRRGWKVVWFELSTARE